jgi:hypothetical protein
MKDKMPTLLQKSKELQPNAQSQRFAAHLLLPQRTSDKQTINNNFEELIN